MIAQGDCNINLKLNHKIPVVFHNIKKCDSHFIMQELGKFDLKINVIPNELEKYRSFTINNKLSLIDSFQFLSSSLDSLVINLGEDDFKYLSQESHNNVLDLIKQIGFYSYDYIVIVDFIHYDYMNDFEKFKDELPRKENIFIMF